MHMPDTTVNKMMRVTERDIDIQGAVGDFGAVTTQQLSRLFGMNIKVCQRRLRKLVEDDYLRFVSLPSTKGKSPYLFYLGGRAEPLIGVSCGKTRLTLRLSHQMKNTDILIDIINSFKPTEIKCEALPEHLIRTAEQDVIPDGAFMLEKENRKALFLLENCSGTEIMRSPSHNQDIETKIIRYIEMFEGNNVYYYEDYFKCSFRRFRLLYITNDFKRLTAIGRVIRDHDIHGFICISTLSELKKNGVRSHIWNIPATNKTGQTIVQENSYVTA